MEIEITCRDCEEKVIVFVEVDEGMIHIRGCGNADSDDFDDSTVSIFCPKCSRQEYDEEQEFQDRLRGLGTRKLGE